VEGCSNRDIAKQFSLSEETVKRHLSNIFDKTGVSTRLELALFAIAHIWSHRNKLPLDFDAILRVLSPYRRKRRITYLFPEEQ